MRLPYILISTVLTVLIAPAVASATFFSAETVDATPGIQRVGDIDIANDGSGAVAYVRNDGGVDHVYVSRLVNGSFQPSERLDGTLAGPGSQPVVAASDGGRVTAAFVNGGAVYAVTRPAGANAFSSPQQLAAGGSSPSVDMSINGVAFASFTTGGDIRVARLERNQSAYSTTLGPLDASANDAGGGLGRSRVATSADGTAVVVWGENGHAFARRVFSDHIAAAPQDLTVGALSGLTGGVADSPWVDIEDDSSYAWTVFREQLSDGRTHIVARRLVGSELEAPADITSGDANAGGRVDMNGRGEGVISAGSGAFGAFVSLIHEDNAFPAAGVSGGGLVNPQTVGAESENNDAFAAWFEGAPGGETVHGTSYDVNLANHTVPAPAGSTLLSSNALGHADPAAGLELGADRAGDMAVAFVQDNGSSRQLVVAGFDHVPGALHGYTTTHYLRASRPGLSWSPSLDLWGLSYQVQIDNQPVATTAATAVKAPASPAKLTDGAHTWRVVAIDRHGQQTASPLRELRIDTTKPALTVKVSGKRKAGKNVKVTVHTSDGSFAAPSGSGVKTVTIAFGDGTRTVARKATHRFRRGSFTIRVRSYDKAGNVALVSRRVRIKK